MRKLIILQTLALLLICVNISAQDYKMLPGLLGINAAFAGKIKTDAEEVSWLDNIMGATLFYQLPALDDGKGSGAISIAIEATALTIADTASVVGFRHYLNGKLGVGVVFFKKKRISFPIHGNIGYSHVIVDKPNANFGAMSLGYTAGIIFFLSQKMSVVARYCYDYNFTSNITFTGYSKISDLMYTTNRFTVGLGFSIHSKSRSKFTKHYQI